MKSALAAATILALASSTYAAVNSTVVACNQALNDCDVAVNANHAYCASQYAGCLGYSPYNNDAELSSLLAEGGTAAPTSTSSVSLSYSNGSATALPAYNNGTGVTTTVVSSFTTVCPGDTTVTYNGVAYTATASETLTITNCPCTLTSGVAVATLSTVPATVALTSGAGIEETSGAAAAATPATTVVGSSSNGSATTASLVAYTGAANKAGVAGVAGILAVAAMAL